MADHRELPRAEYVRYRRHTEAVLVPDCYNYRPTPRWRWLQDLAWSFLMRIGALEETFADKEVFVERRFDVSKLTHLILMQVDDIHAVHGERPRRLVIGETDFKNLMQESCMRHYMRHYMRLQPREFAGLQIEIVPWMRGVIVLP